MAIKVGGGGGAQFGELRAISAPDLLFLGEDGSQWLRSGNLEDDTVTYPDAPVNLGSIDSMATEFNILGEVINAGSVMFEEATQLFYVLDVSGGSVCEVYDVDGVHQSTTASFISGPNTGVSALALYNGVVYVVDGTGVYLYDKAGVYLSTSAYVFSAASSVNISAAYDPDTDNLYVASTAGTGGAVRLLFLNLTTGNNGILGDTPVISGYAPNGLALAFGKLFLQVYSTGATTSRVYSRYFSTETVNSWNNPDVVFTLNDGTWSTLYGFAFDGSAFWGASRTTDTMVKFETTVGVGEPVAATVNDLGSTFYYSRIK